MNNSAKPFFFWLLGIPVSIVLIFFVVILTFKVINNNLYLIPETHERLQRIEEQLKHKEGR